MKPILKSATSGLSTVSGEVIDNVDQYEVFKRSPSRELSLKSFLHTMLTLNFLSLTQLILS